jgi:hypothetical protein
MARLEITTFLSVLSADIDLRRFTVFIGPQAQGKSLVLKLIHFFESVLNRAVVDVVTGDVTVSTLRKESLERFETYFPKYSWGTSAFSAKYVVGDFAISVSRGGGRRNNPATLTLNPALDDALKNAHATYKSQFDAVEISTRSRVLLRRNLINEVLSGIPDFNRFRTEPVFIPASRSFFANIEKNIFALISSKFELDLLMAEFGTMLESTRRNLLMFESVGRSASQRKARELRRSDWSHIINGDYVYDGDEESIETNGRVVRMANSSSGQQEAIPMLLVLDFYSGAEAYSYGRVRGAQGASFLVEEPEAHLFPRAQKAIAALLTDSMNRNPSNRIVFTTHSPYMLTAVNNLSLAGRLSAELPESKRASVFKVAGANQLIGPGQLAAYKVDKGGVESIIDDQSGLVNGMLIDEVSLEFARDFDDLLTLQGHLKSAA